MAYSIGSWSGTVTQNINMVDVFKQQELTANQNQYSYLTNSPMVLRKIVIKTEEGTTVKINGREIELFTGIFETGLNQVDIVSLEFDDAVEIQVYYLF